MSEIELPDFDLSGQDLDFSSDEELDEAIEKSKGGGPRFQPGTNKATITSPVFHLKEGSYMNQNDPTWGTVKIPLVGDGGEQKDHYLLFPTRTLGFTAASGKTTPLLYVKFQEFMAALGVNVTRTNAIKVAHTYFNDASFPKLEGRTLEFEFGFRGKYHLEYSDNVYSCVDQEGNPVTDADGDVLAEPSKEGLLVLLADQGITKVEEFPEILGFTPAKASKIKTKPAQKEEDAGWGF